MKYLLLLIFSSCALGIPFKAKNDYYLSSITEKGITCTKENLNIYISNDSINLLSSSLNLNLNQFHSITYHNTLSYDRKNTEWEITIGNLRKEPYLLLIKNPEQAIIIGLQCYKK